MEGTLDFDSLDIGTDQKYSRLKAYVSQEILNWHSLKHSHSAEL